MHRVASRTFVACAMFIALGMVLSTQTMAAPLKAADPFAGDTWHAVKGSWPGTINFDGKSRKVVLQPLGAPTIQATYSYTLKPANSAKPARGAPLVKEGTLTMTNTAGQVSSSEFRIEGKELTLKFPGGMQEEHYQRFTKAEEEAEKRRLKKLMEQGKLNFPR